MNNKVLFTNYRSHKVWELVSDSLTMYIPYNLINDSSRDNLKASISTFNFQDIDSVVDTLIYNTENNVDDDFIMEI